MSDIAMFGKLPTAADFIRLGALSTPMRTFETWFHEAYTQLRSAGTPSLPARCDVLFPLPEHGLLIVAVAMPSQDRIGRTFPMVVATAIPNAALPQSQAQRLVATARFCQAAATTFEVHAQGESNDLWSAAEQLTPPTDPEFAEAAQRTTMLFDHGRARAMEEACFTPAQNRFYAYDTLCLATQELPPPQARVLLCPTAGHAEHRLFWSEAVGQAVKGRVSLPMMWLHGEDHPDLAIALDKAPKNMLGFLLGQSSQSQALWPLSTTLDSARKRAEEALLGQNWEDSEQTFSSLLQALAHTQL